MMTWGLITRLKRHCSDRTLDLRFLRCTVSETGLSSAFSLTAQIRTTPPTSAESERTSTEEQMKTTTEATATQSVIDSTGNRSITTDSFHVRRFFEPIRHIFRDITRKGKSLCTIRTTQNSQAGDEQTDKCEKIGESKAETRHISASHPPILSPSICFYFLAVSQVISVTTIGYRDSTAANAFTALNTPFGLSMDTLGSLYISDRENHRVIKIEEGFTIGSTVAGTGIPGSDVTQLYQPSGLHVDSGFNIYVVDRINDRVMLWKNNATYGVRVAGNGTTASDLSTLSWPNGITVDSMGNVFVSEYWNHRVTKWTANATYGILVAGTYGAGNTNQHLHNPVGIYLDEMNSHLYVADSYNHRIQRFDLAGNTTPITVAGGNGQGTNNTQLDTPSGVYLSKRTGDVYIADYNNQRIQRWTPNATSGVTVAGQTGVTGTNLTLFNGPWDLILDNNETYLYVSDSNNNRVQRFTLI